MESPPGRSRAVTALQMVMVFWLLGWFIKAYFFFPYLLNVAFRVPVHHALFPPFFESPLVSAAAYLSPLICLPAILRPGRYRMVFSSMVMVVCSLVLLCHINGYNDATFVTSFWVGLWLLWLSWRYEASPGLTRDQACLLARWILGVIFLAGFVGKCTPEYLTGEAFFRIFWEDNNIWPHSWLMKNLSEAQLARLSFYMSRIIIGMELFLAGTPFYSSRHIYWLLPLVLICFTLTNTWAILSVLLCLIGMSLSCWYLSKGELPRYA